jgi:tRNA(Ile)-lysidine synthase
MTKSRYLEIRTWLAGDRIMQIGMSGSKKLQDVFTDCKIPSRERVQIPLLVVDNEVLVIVSKGSPGRKSRNYQVTESTTRVFRFEYRNLNY